MANFRVDRVSAYFSNDMVKCDEEGNWLGFGYA